MIFGGHLYDPNCNRAVFTDEPTVAAFEWIQNCARKVGVSAGAEFSHAHERSLHTAQDPFITEKVAMIVQGPWIAKFIGLHRTDLDFGCVPFPVEASLYDSDRPIGMLEADVLIVPRGCRHPRESFEFVRWMQRQDVQERLAHDHGKGSPFMRVSP